MDVYDAKRPLFLSGKTETVPVIEGWNWQVEQGLTGYLEGPDGARHCRFDLAKDTMTLEPDGEPFQAPGLSLSIVQEMGETYANELVFTPEEQDAYKDHVRVRENTRKQQEQQVRKDLTGVIQLEHGDGTWVAHVDAGKAKDLTGLDVPEACTKEDGIRLFNQLSASLGARPLRDPTGYMALSGNLYEFLHQEYRNQYEDTAQAIDNQFLDGTGYAVNHVLDTLPSVIRKDMQNVLPEGEVYGNLRFVPATDERKKAVKDFVQCRVDKTLTYEKKRSYEPATIDRMNQKFLDVQEHLKDTLSDLTAPDLGACLEGLGETESWQV